MKTEPNLIKNKLGDMAQAYPRKYSHTSARSQMLSKIKKKLSSIKSSIHQGSQNSQEIEAETLEILRQLLDKKAIDKEKLMKLIGKDDEEGEDEEV